MQTNRLNIRRFRKEDTDNLAELLSDPEVMKYIEPPYSKAASDSFLQSAGLAENPPIYAVEDKSGQFAGYVIYHPYSKDSCEIGWLLHQREWHKGYAQELTQALMDDAKGRAEYLIIECAPGQAATKHIALKNGFSYMGNTDGCDVYRLKLSD